MYAAKRFFCFGALVAAAALQFGCGSGADAPAVKLTASAIASTPDATAHTHVVSIPFTDVSAAPASAVYQYRTAVTNGHSHVIAISKQQMMDLDNGMILELTSSSADSGAAHTHSWRIQGGSVLYDQNCYNCHSDGKRGRAPVRNSSMNFSFNASQNGALQNPGGAALSTSPAAAPDPNFSPSATAFDALATYNSVCLGCHNTLGPRTAAQITSALASQNAMKSLSYTAAQIEAIAAASH
jgi:hypothetical protein